MSKILAAIALLLLSISPESYTQWFDYNPGRPNHPTRPGQGSSWPAPRPPAILFQTLGTFRVQKIIETTNNVRVNHPNVKVVRLIARNNDVEIIQARAQMEDGREIYMDSITGGLRRDRSFNYTFPGTYGLRIRSITITAVSRSLIGSRAELEVSVGVFQ